MLALSLLAAVLLDALFGEPRRWHPLVGFGRMASWLEARLNAPLPSLRVNGLIAVALLLVPLTALAWFLTTLPVIGGLLGVLMLYASLGLRSLHEHAQPVAAALAHDDLAAAKQHAAMLVSRDTASKLALPICSPNII